MNWFNRFFSTEHSSERQIEAITSRVMDQCRIAAIESAREQFVVVRKQLHEVVEDNTNLRKTIVDLSTSLRGMKSSVEEMSTLFERSVKRMEGLHLNVSEERGRIANALTTMDRRLNESLPQAKSLTHLAPKAQGPNALISALSSHAEDRLGRNSSFSP